MSRRLAWWHWLRRWRFRRGWARIYGDGYGRVELGDPVTWKSDSQIAAEADLWDSVGDHEMAHRLRSVLEDVGWA